MRTTRNAFGFIFKAGHKIRRTRFYADLKPQEGSFVTVYLALKKKKEK